MGLSNFKLGIYEFLGLMVPGMLLLCEGWIFVRGWGQFLLSLRDLNAAGFSMLAVVAFVLGHFVQELGDRCIKICRGERFFRQGRDRLWATDEAEPIKSAIWTECGLALGGADAAFDYCLTRIGDSFAKRDVFVATSDLCRSFLVLIVLALLPVSRLAFGYMGSVSESVLRAICYSALLALAARLAWTRMVRFRGMSETGVFRAYLGSRPTKSL